MKRADLTEKILDIKREKGWTWAHIHSEIGGISPILITAALLGQMKNFKYLMQSLVQQVGAGGGAGGRGGGGQRRRRAGGPWLGAGGSLLGWQRTCFC